MSKSFWPYGRLPAGVVAAHRNPCIEPDNTEYIEDVLPQEYADAIYRSEIVAEWMEKNQIEILDFGGGVQAITVRMMADLPIEVIKKLKFWKYNKRRRVTAGIAEEIRAALDDALRREP